MHSSGEPTGNRQANQAGNSGGKSAPRKLRAAQTLEDGFSKPDSLTGPQISTRGALSEYQRQWIDQELPICVLQGMTTRQISAYTARCGRQLSYNEVWKRLDRRDLLKRVRSEPHVKGHVDHMIDTFISVALRSDGIEYWEREVSLGGVRCDIEFKTVNGHRYFLEEQESPLDRKRWRQKFRGYVDVYERNKRIFRVLVRVHSAREWTKAIETCFEEMDDHDNLDLFWFSLDGRQWMNRWGRLRVV